MRKKLLSMLLGMCLALGVTAPASAQFAANNQGTGSLYWGDWDLIFSTSPWLYNAMLHWGHKLAINTIPGTEILALAAQGYGMQFEGIRNHQERWHYRKQDSVWAPGVAGATLWVEAPPHEDTATGIRFQGTSGYKSCRIYDDLTGALLFSSNNVATCNAGKVVNPTNQGTTGGVSNYDPLDGYNVYKTWYCINTNCTGGKNKRTEGFVKIIFDIFNSPGVRLSNSLYFGSAVNPDGTCPTGYSHVSSAVSEMCVLVESNRDASFSNDDEASGGVLMWRWRPLNSSWPSMNVWSDEKFNEMDELSVPDFPPYTGPPYPGDQKDVCNGVATGGTDGIWDEIPSSTQHEVCNWGLLAAWHAAYDTFTCHLSIWGDSTPAAIRHASWTANMAHYLETKEGFSRADAADIAREFVNAGEGGDSDACNYAVANNSNSNDSHTDCLNNEFGAQFYEANAPFTGNDMQNRVAIREGITNAVLSGNNSNWEAHGYVDPNKGRHCSWLSAPERVPGSDW